jgi:hypothetical protein
MSNNNSCGCSGVRSRADPIAIHVKDVISNEKVIKQERNFIYEYASYLL